MEKFKAYVAKMGASVSNCTDGADKEHRPRDSPSIVCDECGRVFTISSKIISGAEKIKRCDRPVPACGTNTEFYICVVNVTK